MSEAVRLCALAAVALAAALTSELAPAAPVAASHTGVASYCSRSGDLCFGIFRREREVVFSIDTFARYFSRYSLCVRAPDTVSRCGSYPIFRRNSMYGSNVRWSRNFPNGGRGVYAVTWKVGSNPLGPTLRFRR